MQSIHLKRLQVVIAEAGVASRRAAERLIESGKVRVNGKVVCVQGMKVNPQTDQIEVEGKLLKLPTGSKKYYLFHKPLGVVATLKDRHAKKTVADFFKDVPTRLFPVGRLDQNSTGLLLMTNDGELTLRLTHPRFGIQKVYKVLTREDLPAEKLNQFKHGLDIQGKKTAPAGIERIFKKSSGETEFKVTLHEGKKRQIREMMKALGVHVIALHRKSYGSLTLGKLKPGEKRELTPEEILCLVSGKK